MIEHEENSRTQTPSLSHEIQNKYFIGRTNLEIAHESLINRWKSSSDSDPKIVLIHGVGGRGKSRFLEAALQAFDRSETGSSDLWEFERVVSHSYGGLLATGNMPMESDTSANHVESSASPSTTEFSQAASPEAEPGNYNLQKMNRQKTIDRTINFYRRCFPIDVGSGFVLTISEIIAESGETGLRLQLKVAVAARDSVLEKLQIWVETGYAWIVGKPV